MLLCRLPDTRCPEETVTAAQAALGAGDDEASQSVQASAADGPSRPQEDRGGAACPVGEG